MTARATPILDAAVRAGCVEGCRYPECKPCDSAAPDYIEPALRAALPKEPAAECVEAQGKALKVAFAEPVQRWNEGAGLPAMRLPEWESDSHIWIRLALAAYRAQPLWLELWGEE